jgi:putative ABC transport system substrate-binding protein
LQVRRAVIRAFATILCLSLAAAAGSVVARPAAAQPARGLPTIGVLGAGKAEFNVDQLRLLYDGLREAGYEDGKTVAIEYRWAEDDYARLPALAAELVERKVAVLVALTAPAALAAKGATGTMPIVFEAALDPVASGLVASLAKPGGNVTGATSLNLELAPKRLELLHQVVPEATEVAALLNPANPNVDVQRRDLEAMAGTLRLRLHILDARSDVAFTDLFDRMARLQAGGLVVGADAFLASHGDELGRLARKHRLPAIFERRPFVVAGGLMSYGGGFEAYRQTGLYVGQVLKGAKPADLPVQQSAKIGLIVNLRTAKALSLDLPPTLLGRADEVIE